VGKYFAEHRLQHVELLVGGFGSEEIGDRGAEAYARAHGAAGELDNTVTIVPESCGAGHALAIVSKEKMHGATHDEKTCRLLMEAYGKYRNATTEPIQCDIRALGFAGTDAGPFSLEGYPATAIMGIAGAMNKPANWHSRKDTPQNLNPNCLSAVAEIIRIFVEMVEKQNN
jgi:hypothetical protein